MCSGYKPVLLILILKLILEYFQHCGKCVSPCVFVPTAPSLSLWEPAVAHQALTDAVLSAEPTVRALSAAHPAISPFPGTQSRTHRFRF